MKPAQYAIVRYTADPGRDEALNLGILVWDAEEYRLKVDREAADRAIRESPWLERDALLYVEPLLREMIESTSGYLPERIGALINEQPDFPLGLTDARFTTIADDSPDAIDATLSRLIDRVVRPPRRGGGGSIDLADLLESRIRHALLDHSVKRDVAYRGSRSGIVRTVEFYANSGANTALDTLKLDLKRADEIRRRADAQAYKVVDLKVNEISRYVVLCSLSTDPKLQETNESVKAMLQGEGALVVTDIDEASQLLVQEFEHQY